MRSARNEQDVRLYGIARAGQDAFALDGLLAMQTRSFDESEPFFDSTRVFAVAVVVKDAFAPSDAKGGILAAGENYGVFDGNVRLVIVAIQSPGLQLPAGELAFV